MNPRMRLNGLGERLTAWPRQMRGLFPGLLACAVVAAAAAFLGEHYGAPVMLFALLLGLAMNFLSDSGPQASPPGVPDVPPAAAAPRREAACRPGIEFASKHVLRWGVALLGLRITAEQVAGLGWLPVLGVVAAVAATIVVGVVAARVLGFSALFGLLTGGAVAICGASAALALAAALPAHPQKERAVLFTVIGVSALSTLVMVLYPMLVRAAGLDAQAAGIFLGGTIHDVAQVVGAGYSLGTQAGDTATLVKLLRVAMLLPVIVFAAMLTRRLAGPDAGGAAPGPRPPPLPGFALAFALLVVVNSFGWLPQPVLALGNDLSRGFLVAAIAAIGMKTQLKDLSTVGWKPVALMVGETAFLAALVWALLRFGALPG